MLGRRTIRDLIIAAWPPRVSWVTAILAAGVAVGMHGLVLAMTAAGIGTGIARLEGYARTFEVLPLWLLVGGALHQFAARLLQAWDHFLSWVHWPAWLLLVIGFIVVVWRPGQ